MSLSTAGHGVVIHDIVNEIGPPAKLVKALTYGEGLQRDGDNQTTKRANGDIVNLPVWPVSSLTPEEIEILESKIESDYYGSQTGAIVKGKVVKHPLDSPFLRNQNPYFPLDNPESDRSDDDESVVKVPAFYSYDNTDAYTSSSEGRDDSANVYQDNASKWRHWDPTHDHRQGVQFLRTSLINLMSSEYDLEGNPLPSGQTRVDFDPRTGAWSTIVASIIGGQFANESISQMTAEEANQFQEAEEANDELQTQLEELSDWDENPILVQTTNFGEFTTQPVHLISNKLEYISSEIQRVQNEVDACVPSQASNQNDDGTNQCDVLQDLLLSMSNDLNDIFDKLDERKDEIEEIKRQLEDIQELTEGIDIVNFPTMLWAVPYTWDSDGTNLGNVDPETGFVDQTDAVGRQWPRVLSYADFIRTSAYSNVVNFGNWPGSGTSSSNPGSAFAAKVNDVISNGVIDDVIEGGWFTRYGVGGYTTYDPSTLYYDGTSGWYKWSGYNYGIFPFEHGGGLPKFRAVRSWIISNDGQFATYESAGASIPPQHIRWAETGPIEVPAIGTRGDYVISIPRKVKAGAVRHDFVDLRSTKSVDFIAIKDEDWWSFVGDVGSVMGVWGVDNFPTIASFYGDENPLLSAIDGMDISNPTDEKSITAFNYTRTMLGNLGWDYWFLQDEMLEDAYWVNPEYVEPIQTVSPPLEGPTELNIAVNAPPLEGPTCLAINGVSNCEDDGDGGESNNPYPIGTISLQPMTANPVPNWDTGNPEIPTPPELLLPPKIGQAVRL